MHKTFIARSCWYIILRPAEQDPGWNLGKHDIGPTCTGVAWLSIICNRMQGWDCNNDQVMEITWCKCKTRNFILVLYEGVVAGQVGRVGRTQESISGEWKFAKFANIPSDLYRLSKSLARPLFDVWGVKVIWWQKGIRLNQQCCLAYEFILEDRQKQLVLLHLVICLYSHKGPIIVLVNFGFASSPPLWFLWLDVISFMSQVAQTLSEFFSSPGRVQIKVWTRVSTSKKQMFLWMFSSSALSFAKTCSTSSMLFVLFKGLVKSPSSRIYIHLKQSLTTGEQLIWQTK